MSMAQGYRSQYQTTEDLEVVDVAGPSRVECSRPRSREMTGSRKPKTLRRTSRRHLNFEVISSPIPSHVRPILTAAKRLCERARRTLIGRVRFNPVAIVRDISPLADKTPNEVRLPDDTLRQDDGDALEMVRAEEHVATEEEQAAEVVEGNEPMESEMAQEAVAGEEVGGGESIQEEELAPGGEEEGQEEAEEADDGVEGIQENELVPGGEEEGQEEAEEVVDGAEGIQEEDLAPEGEEEGQEEVVAGVEAIVEEEVVGSAEQEATRAPEAEMVDLQEPAYEILNNTYVCRLPGCPTPDRGFTTLKGWKIHAALTRTHQQQGFCTSCGRCVVMPPQLQDNEKKIWLDSHRRERCEGASRAILKQRRLEKQRLEALWRDASHVKLPDDENETEARRPHKRAYPTEDERRAGVCLAFIKHMKTTNPARLDEVAADFQLTIL